MVSTFSISNVIMSRLANKWLRGIFMVKHGRFGFTYYFYLLCAFSALARNATSDVACRYINYWKT